MLTANFIRLTTEIDKPIYRIMSIARVLQMLESRRLVLVKPKLWDDPFENALLSSTFVSPDGGKTVFAAKDSVYGQCWTLYRETDAMWRIYSGQKDGVRVSTTPRRLFEASKALHPTFWVNRCFIGRVSYLPEKDLRRELGAINLMRQDGSGVAESLLFKRSAFKHEKEVRLIYTGDDLQPGPDLCPFEVDPITLFDEFVFDPRMDDALIAAYSAAMLSKGIPKKSISKSTLYRAPKGLVFKL